jgi:hypothetical protein
MTQWCVCLHLAPGYGALILATGDLRRFLASPASHRTYLGLKSMIEYTPLASVEDSANLSYALDMLKSSGYLRRGSFAMILLPEASQSYFFALIDIEEIVVSSSSLGLRTTRRLRRNDIHD